MNLVNTLCFVGANSSWEEVQSPCTLMEDPKSNVSLMQGREHLSSCLLLLSFRRSMQYPYRTFDLQYFRVQPTCAPFISSNTSLILQFNKNTITHKYSAKIHRHHAFWPLYLLCTLLTVTRNWKSVALFMSDQIKAKEDHLMRLNIFLQFSGSAKFTHYTTAICKREVIDIFLFTDAQYGCIMQWRELALKQIHQETFHQERKKAPLLQ